MLIDNNKKYDFKDVLLLPNESDFRSRSEARLVSKVVFPVSKVEWEGVPLVVANMDTTGTFGMAKELFKHKVLTAIHKFYSLADWRAFIDGCSDDDFNYFMVSTGITESDFERLDLILAMSPKIKFICMDVANGYMRSFADAVTRVREKHPNKVILAGNVVDSGMAQKLYKAGADIVKVGIGSGSVCTTRKVAGVGVPQFSAVEETARNSNEVLICSDGGITEPGDLVKAFGVGADFVMMGSVFAGHDQSGGNRIIKDGVESVEYYGMSSDVAMNNHHGGVNEYRASEGKRVFIPYRGDINNTLKTYLGGLRSSMSYIDARSIDDIFEKARFIVVSNRINNSLNQYE